MFSELVDKIRNHAKNQPTDLMKQYYNDIADALDDEDFIQTLSNTEALSNIRIMGGNFDYHTSNRSSYNDTLNLIHAGYIAYRTDKERNIGSFSQKVRELEDRLQESKEELAKIKEAASDISGTEVLTAYAEQFDNQATKHQEKSTKWLWCLIASIFGLVIIVALILFVQISNFPIIKDWLANDIKNIGMLNALVLAIKGSIVMAYIQIPLFIRKNYFAEKHLEQSSIHRRDVLKALHAVYKTINNQEEKDKIITVGATIAFSEPESGFITRKEGAGGDDSLEAILKIISK